MIAERVTENQRLPRLLIISRSHNPLGGADRIIADLCRDLPSRGWDTILGLTQGALFDDPEAYRQVHQNLPTIDIDGRLGTRTARLKSLRKVIGKSAPDVVLSMRVFDAWDAVARLKSDNLKSAPRLMVGVRAFESPYLSDVRRCRENIDFCVTSGNLIAEACQRIGGMETERVESIGGGVQPPVATVQPREPSSPIRILYAGRLEQQQKRALDLIAFTESLISLQTDFRLDICGAGPEESKLRIELKPLIDAGVVKMHGWVNQTDLCSRFYAMADCFVHFAAWEGVTIAPREAMAHGVVPVISKFTGIYAERQFLNNVNSLMFPVGRPDLAAEQVWKLCSTAGLSRRLSTAAMQSQTGRYSYEGAMDAWRDALNQCLSLPPKAGRFPKIPERLNGRLTEWGIPSSVQLLVRNLLKRPVRHAEAGSEWPTASGLMSECEQVEIAEFAERFEADKKYESAA